MEILAYLCQNTIHMAKYIDPTYDVGFKLTFGRENLSEELLMGILNALLCENDDFEEITSVKYMNNERISDYKDGKGIRYDILCETSSHHRFIVEMQKAHQAYFIDRASFYVARGIAEQGYRGKDEENVTWDYSLKPVYGVFICNFDITSLDQKVITRARVMDEESFKPVGDKTRYYFIQLPRFNKEEDECESLIDKWIYNIKYMGIRQEVAFMRNNEIFKRLERVTSVAALSPEERRSYEADVKNARDTLNQLRSAEQRGEEKGKEIGMKIGDKNAQIRIARNMLQIGMEPESISLCTGLSLTEIAQL